MLAIKNEDQNGWDCCPSEGMEEKAEEEGDDNEEALLTMLKCEKRTCSFGKNFRFL